MATAEAPKDDGSDAHAQQITQTIEELRSTRPLTEDLEGRARKLLDVTLERAKADQIVQSLTDLEAALDVAQSRYATAIRHAPLFYRWNEPTWRTEANAARAALQECVQQLSKEAGEACTKLVAARNLMTAMGAAGVDLRPHPVFERTDRWAKKYRVPQFAAATGWAELQINALLAIVPSMPGEWSKPVGQMLLLALAVLSGSMAHIGVVHGLSSMSLMAETDLLRVVTSAPMLLAVLMLFPVTLLLGALNRHVLAFAVGRIKHALLNRSRWQMRLAAVGMHALAWIALGTLALGAGAGWWAATPTPYPHVCVGNQSYHGQLSVLSTMVIITEQSADPTVSEDQQRTTHWLNRSRFQSMTLSPDPCPPAAAPNRTVKVDGMDALQTEVQAVSAAIAALKPTVIVERAPDHQKLVQVLQELKSVVVTQQREYIHHRDDDREKALALQRALTELRDEMAKVGPALVHIDQTLDTSLDEILSAMAPIADRTDQIAAQINDLRARHVLKRLAELIGGRKAPTRTEAVALGQ